MRAQSWCSLESNFLVQMYLRLLAKCTHDKPLNLWMVRILQCLSSWNTVRLQLWSGILHQYKIRSLYLVVKTFQFVLYIFAVDVHTWHEQWIWLSFHNGSPRSIMARFTFFTHFCDCSVKTELIHRNNCAKNSFNRFKSRRNSVSTIFHHLCS